MMRTDFWVDVRSDEQNKNLIFELSILQGYLDWRLFALPTGEDNKPASEMLRALYEIVAGMLNDVLANNGGR